MTLVPLRNRGLRIAATAAGASLAAGGFTSMTMPAVSADTAPPKGTPATVSADPLPTWQVNGVVWSSVTVGNTVYATGSFTRARPPGTAPGSKKEVKRGNILAFDIRTGNLITGFNHTLNGQGLRLAASPDGKRVYVGGVFTQVDGQARSRIAAFDTATGKLSPSFKPAMASTVRAIAATNTTVFVGGNFFSVNGTARTRLAAVKAAGGALLPWRPVADDNEVFALVVAPGGKRVIVGGRFQRLNGQPQVGVGAVDSASGNSSTWTSRPIPSRAGSQYSYVTDLVTDGKTIYGSADGEGHHMFDGRFAADPANGDLRWLDNCYGATYGLRVSGSTLYSVSHAHECRSLNAFPEVPSRRALAETTYATGKDNSPPGTGSHYFRQPVPSLLHWFPALGIGSYTGQHQAAWTVTGNSKYLVLGGEFPTANGRKQQGLVRYAIRASAPNKVAPQAADSLRPRATGAGRGSVRVSWQATWDQDNRNLRYEVLRDKGTKAVGTVSLGSNFWTLPNGSFTDKGLVRGSRHTYKIRVVDPLGNSRTSAASATVRVP